MANREVLLRIMFVMVMGILPQRIFGQETESLNSLNRAAQYFLGARDEVLVKVNVLGYIQRPGQYLVPRHTDLLSLISFAGGLQKGANLSKVRIMRKAGFEEGVNGKNGHHEKDHILTVNVKRYFESGDSTQIPNVRAGDTILISQSFGGKFRGLLGINTVVGLIAATATTVLIIDRLSR